MSQSGEGETTMLTPDEASEALGNPIRAAILRALWSAPGEALSFSELRRRAGSPDSGQFNYHLGELVGTFVEQTDEGYRPVLNGMRVLRTALFGVDGDPPTFDAVPIDSPCHHCGGELFARYDGQHARVQCGACDKLLLDETVPPATLQTRTPQEAITAFDRWVLARSWLMAEGVCPDCADRPDRQLFQTRHGRNESLSYLRIRHVCGNCGYESDVPVWLHVLLARHSAIVSFYQQRGVDLGEAPVWELTAYGKDARVTLDSEAPVRVGVELEYDGDGLRLTLDETLRVVETTSVRGAARLADN